jgi:hypothetical protein
MTWLLKNFGVAVCGLITSALTALGIVVVEKLTGLDLFTFNIWVIVPAGALLTGFAAASGYYLGSLYFNVRPSIILLLQMVVIAGATQLLIYYLEYYTLVLDDGRRVSDFIGFAKYLDIALTTAHYRVGRGAGVDTGEVGNLGYWIAGVQFLGFLFGGVCVFGWLVIVPFCKACNRYFRSIIKRVYHFAAQDDFTAHYEGVYEHPFDSEEFRELVAPKKAGKVAQGTIALHTHLLRCPECRSQILTDKVKVFNGKDWKDVKELDRTAPLPADADLLSAFNPREAKERAPIW